LAAAVIVVVEDILLIPFCSGAGPDRSLRDRLSGVRLMRPRGRRRRVVERRLLRNGASLLLCGTNVESGVWFPAQNRASGAARDKRRAAFNPSSEKNAKIWHKIFIWGLDAQGSCA
jgi:hypothetical protein